MWRRPGHLKALETVHRVERVFLIAEEGWKSTVLVNETMESMYLERNDEKRNAI